MRSSIIADVVEIAADFLKTAVAYGAHIIVAFVVATNNMWDNMMVGIPIRPIVFLVVFGILGILQVEAYEGHRSEAASTVSFIALNLLFYGFSAVFLSVFWQDLGLWLDLLVVGAFLINLARTITYPFRHRGVV